MSLFPLSRHLLKAGSGPDEEPSIHVWGSPGFRGCIHLITAVSVRSTLTAANSAELPQRPPHLPVSSSFLQAAAPLLLQHDPGEGSMAALTVSLAASTAFPPDAKQPVHATLTA